jgi:hypothetical protein
MKHLRIAAGLLLLALFTLAGPAYTAVDSAVCSAADQAGCTGTNLKVNATEELSAQSARAPYVITSVAGTNTITGCATPAITAYIDGMTAHVKPVAANTGPVTFSWCGVGAIAATSQSGTALAANDLLSTNVYLFRYFAANNQWRALSLLGSGSTIAANSITNSLLAQMPANTIKGNNTGATANAADLTATQTTAMLDAFTSAAKGLVPASGGGTTNFLRADGTFAAPPGGGGGTPGGTSGQIQYNNAGAFGGFTAGGDFTLVPSTGLGTLNANVVTNAKAAQMAANTFKGNNTGATANAADLTAAQAKTVLAITGADVSNTPAGNVAATTVQAAINELDTEKQISDTDLTCIAGLTSAADKIPYFTGAGTCALADFSSTIRTLITTPTSANLRAMLSDELGAGVLVFLGAPADDQVPVGDSATATTWRTLPTTSATQKLSYDAATNSFSAATDDDVPEVGDFAALVGGTGIDNASGTLNFNATEVSSLVWGAGAFTTQTFDAGATDPVFTYSSPATMLMSGGGTSPIMGLDDQGVFRLLEEDAGGNNFLAFQAPAAVTTDATCVFEDDANFIPDSCVGDGSDDDIPEAADFSNLTASTGLVNSPVGTILFDFSDAGASPTLTADATRFTSNATVPGYMVFEGDTADAFETRIAVTDPTADRTFTLPNADSNAVQPLTCGGTDKVSGISSAGVVTCSADAGAGSGSAAAINGSASASFNLNATTPAAPTGGKNVTWQVSAGSPDQVSAYILNTQMLIGQAVSSTATGTQNDFSPTNWDGTEPNKAAIIDWDGTAPMMLTGVAGGTSTRLLVLRNRTTEQLIVIQNEASTSTAANRFTGLAVATAHMVVLPGESMKFIYDATSSRWRPAQPVDELTLRLAWTRIAQVPGTGTAPISLGIAHTTANAGTVSTPTITTTNYHVGLRRTNVINPAAAGSVSGTRHAIQTVWRGNAAGTGGFLAHYIWGYSAINTTDPTSFVGLFSSTAIAPNQNMNANLNAAGFGFNPLDTTIQTMTNDGTTTGTKVNTGIAINTTAVYEGFIFAIPGGTGISFVLWRKDDVTAAPSVNFASTDLPTTTSLLASYVYVGNRAVATQFGIDFMLLEELRP